MRCAIGVVGLMSAVFLAGCDDMKPSASPAPTGAARPVARPSGPPYPPVDMKLVNSQCLIHPGQSAQLAFSAMHEGERYGFCCQGCKQMFVQEPARYLAQQP